MIVVVNDVLEDPRTVNLDWLRAQGFVSLAALPLLFHERVLGVANILAWTPHFQDREIKVLRLFGSQAATALHNAVLYTETTRRQRANEAPSRWPEWSRGPSALRRQGSGSPGHGHLVGHVCRRERKRFALLCRGSTLHTLFVCSHRAARTPR